MGLAQRCTKYVMMQASQNDLGFSLCAVLSVCHMIATSGDGTKSKESEC